MINFQYIIYNYCNKVRKLNFQKKNNKSFEIKIRK